ncbi:alpha/beta fold hydrolase [Streptomyces sp. NPDC005805]|uniref:thioesterase II family protein n=1 Tax=Streptomyces sp. NPDC005805 TaxID=3157068 RepID=UPI0033D8D0BD
MTTPPWQVWLRRLTRPETPRSRLFCFPPAAAGASYFRGWTGLPEDVELWAVQPPGREDRLGDTGPGTVVGTATAVAQALQWVNGVPFHFLGHSLGALVAHETVLRLHRQSMPMPRRLFASGCAAPSAHRVRAFEAADEGAVGELLVSLGAAPETLADSDARALVLGAARTDLAMFFRHRPDTAPLPCPVTVLSGADDPSVPHAALAAWQEASPSPVEQLVFPGTHHFLRESGPAVAEALASLLEAP